MSETEEQTDAKPSLNVFRKYSHHVITVLSLMFIQAIFNGLVKSYGILYLEFLALFERGPGETSWVAFTFALSITLSGFVVGYMADKVEAYILAISASVLGAVGWFTSSFVPNIPSLIFTYGILVGVATLIFFNTTFAFVNTHFDGHPMLANGLMCSGSSLGGIIMPFLITVLVNEYTSRGAMVIMAGIWLNQAVASMLLKNTTSNKTDSTRKAQTRENGISENIPPENTGSYEKNENEMFTNSTTDNVSRSCLKRIRPYISLQFLTSCLLIFLATAALQGISQYFPAYAEESGANAIERSTFLAISSSCDLIARLTLAFVGDLRWVNKDLLLSSILTVGGTFAIILPFTTNKVMLYVYSAVFGLTGDMVVVFTGGLMKESLGEQHIGKGMGIAATVYGLAGMLISTLLGYLVQFTETYSHTLLVAGSAQILGAFIFYVIGGRFKKLFCCKVPNKS